MLLILRLKRHKIDCNVFLLCVRGLYRLAYQNAFMGRLCVLQIGRLCVYELACSLLSVQGFYVLLDACPVGSKCFRANCEHTTTKTRNCEQNMKIVNEFWNRIKTTSKSGEKFFGNFCVKIAYPGGLSKICIIPSRKPKLHKNHPKNPRTKISDFPTKKCKGWGVWKNSTWLPRKNHQPW